MAPFGRKGAGFPFSLSNHTRGWLAGFDPPSNFWGAIRGGEANGFLFMSLQRDKINHAVVFISWFFSLLLSCLSSMAQGSRAVTSVEL